MPEYSRVEFPMLRIIPLRRAKPGMELEKSAFDRDGRVIAEPGEVLTEDRLQKFENLNVRKIVVSDTNVQWIPADDAQSYSDDLTVLETRDFNEAAGEIVESLQAGQSIEELRRTALYLREQAERAGDAGGVAYLDDLIDRSYQLEADIDDLIDRLESVENEQAREELMEALEGTIRRLDQVFMEVSAPDSLVKDSVQAVNEREGLRSDLSEYVIEHPEVLLSKHGGGSTGSFEVDLPAENNWSEPLRTLLEEDSVQGVNQFIAESQERGISSSRIDDLQEIAERIRHQVEEKHRLKEKMSEFDLTLEQRKTLTDALEGRESFRKSELLSLPVSQQFATKTFELMQEEMDTRYRLWETLNEVSDEAVSEAMDKQDFIRASRSEELSDEISSEQESEPDDVFLDYDVLRDILVKLREDVPEGLEETLDALNQQEPVNPELISTIEGFAEEFQSLSDRRVQLEERIEVQVDESSTRKYLLNLLDREIALNSDELFEADAAVGLLEEVADHVSLFNENLEEVRDLLNSLSDRELPDIRLKPEEGEPFDDARGTGGSAESSAEAEESGGETPLLEFIQDSEAYEIANRTGLETSTVEAAREFLARPDQIDPEGREYIEPLADQIKRMFYGRELDEGVIREVAVDLTEELVAMNRPLKMFLEPPEGKRYILSHGINTCLVSLSLANQFNYDEEEILDLATASLSLDLGMIEIPTGLWARQDSLSDRGGKEVRKHPTHSKEIIGTVVNEDETLQDLVHQHHERSDGTGYPQGLKKEKQHPLAPVLGTADAYVAMLEERPYRRGKSPDVAMTTLLRNRDEFDKSVVKGLVETIGIYPNGSVVLLTDGRMALVKSQNPDKPTKPETLVLTDRDRNRLGSPAPLDLSENGTGIEETLKW